MRCSRLLCTAEAEVSSIIGLYRWAESHEARAGVWVDLHELARRLRQTGGLLVCHACLFRAWHGMVEWHGRPLPFWVAVAYAADDGARWRWA